VITIENACLYVFPNTEAAEKLIKFFSPRIKFVKPDENFLIVALKKQSISMQQQKQQFLNNSGLGGVNLNVSSQSQSAGGGGPPLNFSQTSIGGGTLTSLNATAGLIATHSAQFLPPLG
jgi:hypothetical protein